MARNHTQPHLLNLLYHFFHWTNFIWTHLPTCSWSPLSLLYKVAIWFSSHKCLSNNFYSTRYHLHSLYYHLHEVKEQQEDKYKLNKINFPKWSHLVFYYQMALCEAHLSHLPCCLGRNSSYTCSLSSILPLFQLHLTHLSSSLTYSSKVLLPSQYSRLGEICLFRISSYLPSIKGLNF